LIPIHYIFSHKWLYQSLSLNAYQPTYYVTAQ
jgi:hypothetical protein